MRDPITAEEMRAIEEAAMASGRVTGAALMGFVLVHLLGNLTLFADSTGETFDAYAHAIESNPLLPVAEIKARAQAIGEDLAAQPRQAVKSMLDVVVGHETRTLAQSIEDEMNAAAANRGTADAREGRLAFIEKRKPVFNQTAD